MEDLKVKYNKKPIVGDIYTLNNLKVLLDDLLNEYLIRSGHKRNFLFGDIKNIIGILSLILSGICCYLSVNYKFDIVKIWISACVLGYFAVNLISLLISYVEGDSFHYDSFQIKTRVDNTPTYVVLVYKKGKVIPKKYIKSVLDLFDDTGLMDHNLFLSDMQNLFSQ